MRGGWVTVGAAAGPGADDMMLSSSSAGHSVC